MYAVYDLLLSTIVRMDILIIEASVRSASGAMVLHDGIVLAIGLNQPVINVGLNHRTDRCLMSIM